MNQNFCLLVMLLTFDWKTVKAALDPQFSLKIIHMNDILSRFDEICKIKKDTSSKFRRLKKCSGGFIEVEKFVHFARNRFTSKKESLVLTLSAGDAFTGHLWYTLFGAKMVADFFNPIKFDAIALGEKEFEGGIYGLKTFLENLNTETKVLCCNLIVDNEPILQNLSRIKKSTTITISLQNAKLKIGIVGYTYKSALAGVFIGRLEVTDEIEAVVRESNHLKYDEKCDFIIALGHSDIKNDMKIARKASVDLVISGHTADADLDKFEIMTNENLQIKVSKTVHEGVMDVYICKTNPYLLDIGLIDVQYFLDDKDFHFRGAKTILFDDNISLPETTGSVQRILRSYAEKTQLIQKHVMITSFEISDDIEDCKSIACDLCSLLSDSMVWTVGRSLATSEASNYVIDGAIVTSGAIKSHFSSKLLTQMKLRELFTNNENIRLLKIFGDDLIRVFMQNAKNYLTNDFLQVSKEIRVYYRMTSLTSISLTNVSINGSLIDKNKVYHIICTSYLKKGNGGYDNLERSEELSIQPFYEFQALNYFLEGNINYDVDQVRERIQIYISKANTLLLFQVYLLCCFIFGLIFALF